MDRLNDVIPKIEANLAEDKIKTQETGILFKSMNSILDQEIERLSTENAQIDSHLQEIASQEMALVEQPTLRMPKLNMTNLCSPLMTDSVVEESAVVTEVEHELPEVELETPVVEESAIEEQIVEEPKEDFVLPTIQLEEPIDLEEEKEESVEPVPMITLTEEQKAIFSYFIPVKGMEQQLCKALAGIVSNYKGSAKTSTGNLVVQGSQGCGKTMLATSIVKVLQKECGHPNGKIGKIDGDALNKKDVQQLLRKVAGGCLIIENAGALNKDTALSLSLLLKQDTSGLLIIIEDSAVGINKLLSLEDSLAKMFTETVSVPIFSNDDLVVFAQSYADELGYVIDEMAILALHNSISNIEKYDQATTLEEVKEIIDDAIDREAHGGLRKAFNILTAKRYTDDDKIVLTEKDFE